MGNSVFLVEDHPVMRQMLTVMLRRTPDLAFCGAAETAVEALEMLAETSPNVVLVDMSLPGMSGIELIEQLQSRFPDLPSLVVSGHDEAVHAETALRAGARGYVMKGNPPDIIEAIRHVLGGQVYLSDRARKRIAAARPDGQRRNGTG